MYPGQLITYKVSPFKGVQMNWVTEITHVLHGEYFVDEQRFGPYRFWHHRHFLESVDNGAIMTDLVSYKLPMGIIGKMMHFLFIKKQLLRIFNYRFQKIEEMFDQKGELSSATTSE
jgi:ligand-binding SRPBCC domain-containing protein